MQKTIFIILIVLIVGVGAFFYFTRPPENPSTDIQSAAENNQNPENLGEGETLYRVSQEDSKIEFTIDELLRGEPFTVVGATNQVAGDVIVGETENGTNLEIGTITINARTFRTDSSQRDGAISRFILNTDNPDNEFITLAPTGVSGVPERIEEGVPYSLEITGDLTISGITKPAVFDATLIRTGSEVSATISATLLRSDFSLVIPDIPFVAEVPDAFSVTGTVTAPKAN